MDSDPRNDAVFIGFERQTFFSKTRLQKSTAAHPNEGKLLKIQENQDSVTFRGGQGHICPTTVRITDYAANERVSELVSVHISE